MLENNLLDAELSAEKLIAEKPPTKKLIVKKALENH